MRTDDTNTAHYITVLRKGGQYYLLNDSDVEQIEEQDARSLMNGSANDPKYPQACGYFNFFRNETASEELTGKCPERISLHINHQTYACCL